jgi:hypothetical protein
VRYNVVGYERSSVTHHGPKGCGSTTLGVKLEEQTRERLKALAKLKDRTSH